jgi:8-oxo-dGTP pyrophosphatase MutT (NUDIX family)
MAKQVVLAGLALVKTGKLLLVHPTGGAPEGTWSIPKGHQDPGEPTIQAAIREVFEEVGIEIHPDLLKGVPHRVYKKGRKKKVLLFWVINVHWLPIPDVLPMEQLQLEEIDEARFVDVLEADFLIEPWQREIISKVPMSIPNPSVVSYEAW